MATKDKYVVSFNSDTSDSEDDSSSDATPAPPVSKIAAKPVATDKVAVKPVATDKIAGKKCFTGSDVNGTGVMVNGATENGGLDLDDEGEDRFSRSLKVGGGKRVASPKLSLSNSDSAARKSSSPVITNGLANESFDKVSGSSHSPTPGHYGRDSSAGGGVGGAKAAGRPAVDDGVSGGLSNGSRARGEAISYQGLGDEGIDKVVGGSRAAAYTGGSSAGAASTRGSEFDSAYGAAGKRTAADIYSREPRDQLLSSHATKDGLDLSYTSNNSHSSRSTTIYGSEEEKRTSVSVTSTSDISTASTVKAAHMGDSLGQDISTASGSGSGSGVGAAATTVASDGAKIQGSPDGPLVTLLTDAPGYAGKHHAIIDLSAVESKATTTTATTTTAIMGENQPPQEPRKKTSYLDDLRFDTASERSVSERSESSFTKERFSKSYAEPDSESGGSGSDYASSSRKANRGHFSQSLDEDAFTSGSSSAARTPNGRRDRDRKFSFEEFTPKPREKKKPRKKYDWDNESTDDLIKRILAEARDEATTRVGKDGEDEGGEYSSNKSAYSEDKRMIMEEEREREKELLSRGGGEDGAATETERGGGFDRGRSAERGRSPYSFQREDKSSSSLLERRLASMKGHTPECEDRHDAGGSRFSVESSSGGPFGETPRRRNQWGLSPLGRDDDDEALGGRERDVGGGEYSFQRASSATRSSWRAGGHQRAICDDDGDSFMVIPAASSSALARYDAQQYGGGGGGASGASACESRSYCGATSGYELQPYGGATSGYERKAYGSATTSGGYELQPYGGANSGYERKSYGSATTSGGYELQPYGGANSGYELQPYGGSGHSGYGDNDDSDDDDAVFRPQEMPVVLPDSEFIPSKSDETESIVKERTAEVRSMVDKQDHVLRKLKTASESFDELDAEIRTIRQQFIENQAARSSIVEAILQETRAGAGYGGGGDDDEEEYGVGSYGQRRGRGLYRSATADYSGGSSSYVSRYGVGGAGGGGGGGYSSRRNSICGSVSGSSRYGDDDDDRSSYRSRFTRDFTPSRFEPAKLDHELESDILGGSALGSLARRGPARPRAASVGFGADLRDEDRPYSYSSRSSGLRSKYRALGDDSESVTSGGDRDDDTMSVRSGRSSSVAPDDDSSSGYVARNRSSRFDAYQSRQEVASRFDQGYGGSDFSRSRIRRATSVTTDYERPKRFSSVPPPDIYSRSSTSDGFSSRFLNKVREKKATGVDLTAAKKDKPFRSRFLRSSFGKDYSYGTSRSLSVSDDTSYRSSYRSGRASSVDTSAADTKDTKASTETEAGDS